MDTYNTRQTLIMRVKNQHDDPSWEEFANIYRGYIYAVIRNMGIAESDREELVQQTLIKLWKKLPDIDVEHSGKFRSWLSTLTKNCVIDFIRKRKREINLREKAADQEDQQQVNTVLPDIDRISEAAWKQHLAALALDNIEPHFSGKAVNVFRLSLQGLDVPAIAEKLEIKEESVYRLKTRVKARLIEEIQRLRSELE
ncbi:RNA polymerase sigma factor [Pontiella desulfatans]|nr:sigma-70 family RNA polymerase sigma factor [Pontiella desulfatans]